MSANPGDLVVCIDAGVIPHPAGLMDANGLLVEGRLYRVSDLVLRGGKWSGIPAYRLRGVNHLGFAIDRFRKVDPDNREPCEEEFRILLKLSKQRVSA